MAILGAAFPVLLVLALGGEAAAQNGRFRPYLLIPWGQGPGQAGKATPPEGAAEGPASFAVSSAGEIYLLDQVNDRILWFSAAGKCLSQIPLNSESLEFRDRAYYEELEIAPGGQLVVLDPTLRQELVVFTPEGRVAARYPLASFGVAATPHDQCVYQRIWVYPDGLYLQEARSGRYFRPLNADLKPVKYHRLPGLPFQRSKKLLSSEYNFKNKEIILTITDKETLKEKTRIIKEKDIIVYYFGKDQSDYIYVVYHLYPDQKQKRSKIEGVKYDQELHEKAKFSLIIPNEIHLDRELKVKVTQDGTVYLMAYTSPGVQIFRWP